MAFSDQNIVSSMGPWAALHWLSNGIGHGLTAAVRQYVGRRLVGGRSVLERLGVSGYLVDFKLMSQTTAHGNGLRGLSWHSYGTRMALT